MIISMIKDVTRICGKSQGFLGLPVRDEIINDKVIGKVNRMQTAWEPTPGELEALNAGGKIIVGILGDTPPPMMVWVENIEGEWVK